MKDEELTQKNRALWIQYSSLSIGRSHGTELLDNGGYATVPVRLADAPRNAAGQAQGERAEGVVS